MKNNLSSKSDSRFHSQGITSQKFADILDFYAMKERKLDFTMNLLWSNVIACRIAFQLYTKRKFIKLNGFILKVKKNGEKNTSEMGGFSLFLFHICLNKHVR